MEWLKSWIITISTTVIFITCVELILPNNKMKKYAKFVLGLILIVVILKPIISLFSKQDINNVINDADKYINIKKYDINLDKFKNTNKDKIIKTFEEKLQKSCQKILKNKYPENNYKIQIKAKFEDYSSKISITKVDLGVEEKDKVKKIQKIEINTKSKTQKDKIDNNKEIKIKEFISSQLNISKENIDVYKLKGGYDEN